MAWLESRVALLEAGKTRIANKTREKSERHERLFQELGFTFIFYMLTEGLRNPTFKVSPVLEEIAGCKITPENRAEHAEIMAKKWQQTFDNTIKEYDKQINKA